MQLKVWRVVLEVVVVRNVIAGRGKRRTEIFKQRDFQPFSLTTKKRHQLELIFAARRGGESKRVEKKEDQERDKKERASSGDERQNKYEEPVT